MAAIGIENSLPVGWMNLSPPSEMSYEKAPVRTPVTAVHAPDPKRIGCTAIFVSGVRIPPRIGPCGFGGFRPGRVSPIIGQTGLS